MNKPSKVTDLDWKLITEKYNEKQIKKIVKLIDKNYPIQYIIGNVDFMGYEIFVKKGVLIPRFETEGLLDETIKLLKKEKMVDLSDEALQAILDGEFEYGKEIGIYTEETEE